MRTIILLAVVLVSAQVAAKDKYTIRPDPLALIALNTKSAAERGAELLQMVKSDGLDRVAQRSDLDQRDLGLLSLIAPLDRSDASMRVQKFLDARLPKAKDARFSQSDAKFFQASMNATSTSLRDNERFYQVTFRNETSDVLTEVVLFWQETTGMTTFLPQQWVNLGPGQTALFNITECSKLVSYTMGIFIGNDLIFKIPSTGVMTPALAGQLHPEDKDLCMDWWKISEN